ncbi:hypothetical protein [Kitasatospora sp. NPDC094015]|uniref:hypothetical protein n=1 Tax=Kitasatospora sp. NPDC094015 TaxID=3155205 RepID=UPI003320862F
MSERRDRRRLHARARALGVPIEQAARRTFVRRPERPLEQPTWWGTDLPDRDEAPAVVRAAALSSMTCCTVVHDRQLSDGGTVVMVTRHAATCPIWSAR